jgi:hypothetical protein
MDTRELKILIKNNMVSKIQVTSSYIRIYGMPEQTIVTDFGKELRYCNNRGENRGGKSVFPQKDVLEYAVRIIKSGFKGVVELDTDDLNDFALRGLSASDAQIHVLIARGIIEGCTIKDVTDPVTDVRESYQVVVMGDRGKWRVPLKSARGAGIKVFRSESAAMRVVEQYRREINARSRSESIA